MLNKRFDIADDSAKIFCRTTFTRRMAVTARVPCKDSDIFEAECFDRFLPAGGMLVAAMEKQERFVSWFGGKPCAIKKFHPIPTLEGLCLCLHNFKLP